MRLRKNRLNSHPVWEKVGRKGTKYTEEEKAIVMDSFLEREWQQVATMTCELFCL